MTPSRKQIDERPCRRHRILAILAVLAALIAGPALASSHREAPFVTEHPKVDGTDFYMFRSYEPGREGFVTLLANYNPLQDPFGGPNYFSLDPSAKYEIRIDNDGDGVEDLTFQFQVTNFDRDIALPVGPAGEETMVSIPLLTAGQLLVRPGGLDLLNQDELYTVQVLRGPATAPTSVAPAMNGRTGGAYFAKPLDNVGTKTIPDYAAYARLFLDPIEIPGCATPGRVFVGQRKEGFQVNLGETFDLVDIANPLGPRDAERSATADKNVTTFALEVPSECLTEGRGDVIGGWTVALLPRVTELASDPTYAEPERPVFTDPSLPTPLQQEFVQVSRLGMPLVNEVVIGLKDKNRFNASQPKDDAQFATYVTNPTLPELLEILFGGAGVRAPNNFPRRDLLAAFVTGIDGLNRLGFGEMQRLNTAIAPTGASQQNSLGVLGGDTAGFPNGRRPGDDVVDIELRVAMGALCHALPGVFCEPADAPSGSLPFTDGALVEANQFDDAFPYLETPIAGSPNSVNGVGTKP